MAKILGYKHKELKSESNRAEHSANKDHNNKRRKRNAIVQKYGISKFRYDEILLEQNKRCAICSVNLDKPCLDHDHVTGTIYKFLCTACNTGLGFFGENKDLLQKAIDYLVDNKKEQKFSINEETGEKIFNEQLDQPPKKQLDLPLQDFLK